MARVRVNCAPLRGRESPVHRRRRFFLVLLVTLYFAAEPVQAQSGLTCGSVPPVVSNTPSVITLGDERANPALPPGDAAAPASAQLDNPTLLPAPCCANDESTCSPIGGPVWGDFGLRLYPYGNHVAPDGSQFEPLFSLDLDFNFWLWRPWHVYLFSDTRFWGEKPGAGVTNSSQGVFDFSKREFDLSGGIAWNYYGRLEFRALGYSFNNLNRGDSSVTPEGFSDGIGIENRCYLGNEYFKLGTPDYDVVRASFFSVGYYPSKTMVDAAGNSFRPGPFARVYLVYELLGPKLYLFTDDQFIMDSVGTPTTLITDSGVAFRPFKRAPRVEFRVGSEDQFELDGNGAVTTVYLSVNLVF